MDFSLQDGKLLLPGMSEEQINKLYHKLRIDLMDCNIPHYRPVAFLVEGVDGSSVLSNIDKITHYGYSYAELGFLIKNLALFEKRGVMPTELNKLANVSKLKSDCTYLSMIGTRISTDEPNSMFYTSEGISAKPNLLIKDLTVFEKLKDCMSVTVILMLGTGQRDFDNNQVVIRGTDFRPVRTLYSLYDYFSIYEYIGGGYIEFTYLENIDEEVLSNILRNYFKQEEVIQCLK